MVGKGKGTTNEFEQISENIQNYKTPKAAFPLLFSLIFREFSFFIDL